LTAGDIPELTGLAVTEPKPPERTGERDRRAVPLPAVSPLYWYAKRTLDVAAAALALTLFGLLLPWIAVAIKLDSPGPVFYSQERIGINRRRRRTRTGMDRRKVLQPGRPFRIYKLRTMCVNAEAEGPRWAQPSDSRVTRVGKFLRKTRLDEVPQFVNVLRGEMSLIGPRPERFCFMRELECEIPHYTDRLTVTPGITGLAQVVNGYDRDTDSVRRKVELDCHYIKNLGFVQDLRILLRTVRVVLKGEGAH
jgi:lipopolysaccharide/colanic/teichoic acid biosynthesis glycosyltransferase